MLTFTSAFCYFLYMYIARGAESGKVQCHINRAGGVLRQFLELNPQAELTEGWQLIARIDPLQHPMPPETQYWSRQAVRLRQRTWTPSRRASRARFLWQLHRELWAETRAAL